MKIIKTRKRTEIEISHLELRQMLFSEHPQMKECASNILTMVKKANRYNYKKDFDDAMFNLYSGTSTKKAPDITKETSAECSDVLKFRLKGYEDIATDYFNGNDEKSIFKSDDDIRKEEREKIFNSTLGDICYIDKGNGKKERWVKTFNGRATLLDNKMMESLKKNIRQEEREKVIKKVLEIMKENGNVYHNSYRDIRELKN